MRTFFCVRCHQRCLAQFHNPSEIRIDNIAVRSLFRWPPGKSDVLSALILQMKDESETAWKIWAQEFVIKWHDTALKKDSVLISSESSSRKNHAQNWGKALSEHLGFPHFCPLKPTPGVKAQKKKSRLERSLRTFDLDVDFSKPANKRIIFVDDVVTTGQTALAAHEALKEPSDFEIWSLIYREL